MIGFLESITLVMEGEKTTDEAYKQWKRKYPIEYNKLSEKRRNSWKIFRLAVSKLLGRGLYFNMYRHNLGRKPVTCKRMGM